MERRINLFDVNVTDGKEQEDFRLDGEVFITQRISDELQKRRNQLSERVEHLEQEAKVPAGINILQYLLLAAGICAVGVLLKEGSAMQADQLLCAIIAFVGFGSIAAAKYARRKKVRNSADVEKTVSEGDQLTAELQEELGVPRDAACVDVLQCPYRIKNGKRKEPYRLLFQFINCPMFVYLQQDCLCFSDLNEVISIPRNQIAEIRKINKRVVLSSWNKEESSQSKKFRTKEYSVGVQNGTISVKPYYSLQIRSRSGKFEILIPGYDIATVTELTGCRIAEE